MKTHKFPTVKVTLSSKGQLIIPKNLRHLLNLHSGTEIILLAKRNGTLELNPVKRSIDNFFGRCKNNLEHPAATEDIDTIIMQTILENDRR
jgi:antitoxin PrlF